MATRNDSTHNGTVEEGISKPYTKQSNKYAYWIGTIPAADWSPPQDIPAGITYMEGQKEIGGSSGFEHWQIVVYFSSRLRLLQAKKYFPTTAHLEPTRSEAARTYVSKDDTAVGGTRFRLGSLPLRRNNRTDWDEVWRMAQSGTISPIPANIRVQNYRTLKQISADYAVPNSMFRKTKVYWGRTGVGKSRRAWYEAGIERTYAKDPRSKWWCGYRDQINIVMDEFRGSIDISHMLRWTDRYPFTVETKGGSKPAKFTSIWITSNLHPRDWYVDLDAATVDALLRRLEIEEMVEPWTEPEDIIDVDKLIELVNE